MISKYELVDIVSGIDSLLTTIRVLEAVQKTFTVNHPDIHTQIKVSNEMNRLSIIVRGMGETLQETVAMRGIGT